MSATLHRYQDSEAMAWACAKFFADQIARRLTTKDTISLGISGGSMPEHLFPKLVKMQVEWSRVHIFWVDERPVPPDHPESNYGKAKIHLLDAAAVPQDNIHRIHGELPPEEAASHYVEEILGYFKTPKNRMPSFDLLYLGIGADAHMGSLFPGQEKIMNTTDIAAALWVPEIDAWRITLLPGAMFAAGQMVFFVSGNEKAEAVRNLFREAYFPLKYPAQILTRNARNIDVFLDEDAASML